MLSMQSSITPLAILYGNNGWMLIIMINFKENKFIALSLLTDESFPYFQNETFYD